MQQKPEHQTYGDALINPYLLVHPQIGSPDHCSIFETQIKKTIIALAVLGSIAGVAQAQSSVTVYGVLDLGLAHENNGTNSVTRMDGGNLNSNRIGFKGTEDLGGGLSAIFQIESGFNADTGAQTDATKLFNRQTFVGMTGGFGTVKLGRQYNPIYSNLGTYDPFGISLAGDSSRLFSYNGTRTDNLITYNYAANGFRGELQYGLGEVAGNSSANRTIAGYFGYRNGPIDVVLTHQNIRNDSDTDSTKMTLLGGNYNFGIIKAFASYAWEKGVGTRDQRDALVGLSAAVSPAGTVMLSYVRKMDRTTDNADAKLVAIGYTHALSKRTSLYTSYGVLLNDAAAGYKISSNNTLPAADALGNRDRLFNVGIRHFF